MKKKDDLPKYDPTSIEQKYQKIWEENKIFSPDIKTAKRPFYNLMMFPYPSAEGMHVGNMFMQTGSDIYGRFMRMQGYDVLEPMGLDGFGIHSENYALKIGKHPMQQAEVSQKNFYRQMRLTGSSFDWERLLETYDPGYYKWTQWLFIQMFKHGLAYRQAAEVNWCPSCKTVLSDEQVIAGECERCGSVVEKKNLEQWFFRITKYAEKLLDNIEELDWSERVKIAQRNWIGRSTGAKIWFDLDNLKQKLEVFTTRPDTLYGATFMVVSPEHPLVASIIAEDISVEAKQLEKINVYVEQARKKTDQERTAEGKDPSTSSGQVKTGVFSGVYAINPVSHEKIPVWIADYVLMGYGTGAIMAVPAHDQRDYEFAKKYDLPIRHVIIPSLIDQGNPPQEGKENTRRTVILAIVRDPKNNKYLTLTWKKQRWRTFITGGVEEVEDIVEAAKREISEETGYTDVEFVRELGGPTEAFFYAAHKGVNRQTQAHILLFNLKSDKQTEVAISEREEYEAEWLSEDEVVSAEMRHSEFDLIWERIQTGNDTYIGSGKLINSGEWDGLKMPHEMGTVISSIEKVGIGKAETTYHLRDWLISRQRYWGPPIPMIYCESCAKEGKSWLDTDEAIEIKARNPKHKISNKSKNSKNQNDFEFPADMRGWYPVPDSDLPVKLPNIKDFKPLGTGKAPLANHPEFYEVNCPQCGKTARRETDVSDTFLDSAWYFLRYPSTDIEKSSFDIERTKKWLPVNIYIGGAEHSVLHLLYARFMSMALKDMGYIDFEEPFSRFFAHGLIIKEGAKMSKSKGNVIVPDEYIAKYGADTLRMYLMFLGPFSQGGDFYDTGIEGMNRFVKRVWVLLQSSVVSSQETENRKPITENRIRFMHKTIKAVTEDISNLEYNTAIARLMEWYNFLSAKLKAENEKLSIEERDVFLKLLAPFAPHMTEELYQQFFGNPKSEIRNPKFKSIHLSPWPKYDEKYLEQDIHTVIIQINGKRRAEMNIEQSLITNKEHVEKKAGSEAKRYLENAEILKVVHVPGKIINFVVKV